MTIFDRAVISFRYEALRRRIACIIKYKTILNGNILHNAAGIDHAKQTSEKPSYYMIISVEYSRKSAIFTSEHTRRIIS